MEYLLSFSILLEPLTKHNKEKSIEVEADTSSITTTKYVTSTSGNDQELLKYVNEEAQREARRKQLQKDSKGDFQHSSIKQSMPP